MIQFTDEEIENIKGFVSNKELIDEKEKEEIKRLAALSVKQDYGLALLFVRCFDCLSRIHDSLKDEDNDYTLRVDRILMYTLEECGIKDLREIVQRLQRIDGGIGTYKLQNILADSVSTSRQYMLDFTGFFMKVGVEE